MGVQKNATYKVHNGTDFDEINFKTIAAQVKLSDGKDAETAIKNTIKSNLAIEGSLAFAEGYTNSIYLSEDGIVTINFGIRYYIKDSNGLVTGQQLFTLPTNLRPKQDIIIPALAVRVGSLSNAVGYLYIRANGFATFSLVGDQTAYSQVCGTAVFSVK